MRQLKSAATPLSLRRCQNTIHSGIRRTAILLYRIVPPDTRFLYKNHVFTAVQALFSYNLVWITVYGRLTHVPKPRLHGIFCFPKPAAQGAFTLPLPRW